MRITYEEVKKLKRGSLLYSESLRREYKLIFKSPSKIVLKANCKGWFSREFSKSEIEDNFFKVI